MTRTLPLAGLLLLAPLAAPLFAQSTAGAPPRPTLDANRDGVVDRAEAAAHPEFAARFDRLDRNHDGRLTADERPAHPMGKPHGKRHGKRHGGLERLDGDRDGRISRAEFDAGQAARAARHAQAQGDRAHARRQPLDFAAIDANRDGYIVRTELRAYHERMRPQREAEHAARLDARFTEADLNRDGKLGRAEVEEKLPRLAQRFAWLDDDRDGFLSRAELQPQRPRR